MSFAPIDYEALNKRREIERAQEAASRVAFLESPAGKRKTSLESAQKAVRDAHQMTRAFGGGTGPEGWQQAVCSCGWKGRAVGAYQDNQLSMIQDDRSAHSREIRRESDSAYWRVYREMEAVEA